MVYCGAILFFISLLVSSSAFPFQCHCSKNNVRTTIRSMDSLTGRSTALIAVDYKNHLWFADITIHTPPMVQVKTYLDMRENHMYIMSDGECYKSENTSAMAKFFGESLPQCFLKANSRLVGKLSIGETNATEWTHDGLSEVDAPLVANTTVIISERCVPMLQTIHYRTAQDGEEGVVAKLYVDFKQNVNLDDQLTIPDVCLHESHKLSNAINPSEVEKETSDEDYWQDMYDVYQDLYEVPEAAEYGDHDHQWNKDPGHAAEPTEGDHDSQKTKDHRHIRGILNRHFLNHS